MGGKIARRSAGGGGGEKLRRNGFGGTGFVYGGRIQAEEDRLSRRIYGKSYGCLIIIENYGRGIVSTILAINPSGFVASPGVCREERSENGQIIAGKTGRTVIYLFFVYLSRRV